MTRAKARRRWNDEMLAWHEKFVAQRIEWQQREAFEEAVERVRPSGFLPQHLDRLRSRLATDPQRPSPVFRCRGCRQLRRRLITYNHTDWILGWQAPRWCDDCSAQREEYRCLECGKYGLRDPAWRGYRRVLCDRHYDIRRDVRCPRCEDPFGPRDKRQGEYSLICGPCVDRSNARRLRWTTPALISGQPGKVYLLVVWQSRACKVGFIGRHDRSVRDRIKDMQTGNPYPIEELAVRDSYKSVEAALLERLRPHKLPGGSEWFRLCDDVLAAYESVHHEAARLAAAEQQRRLSAVKQRQRVDAWMS